jgi:CRISPR-associated protein Cas2
MLFYLICYDIPDDKRRKKIADLLEGYGKRVQYSVFECVLVKNKYEELQKRLLKCLKKEEDNIRFYPVSSHTLTQVITWGIGPDLTKSFNSVII